MKEMKHQSKIRANTNPEKPETGREKEQSISIGQYIPLVSPC
jgi:hypothetical protein